MITYLKNFARGDMLTSQVDHNNGIKLLKILLCNVIIVWIIPFDADDMQIYIWFKPGDLIYRQTVIFQVMIYQDLHMDLFYLACTQMHIVISFTIVVWIFIFMLMIRNSKFQLSHMIHNTDRPPYPRLWPASKTWMHGWPNAN